MSLSNFEAKLKGLTNSQAANLFYKERGAVLKPLFAQAFADGYTDVAFVHAETYWDKRTEIPNYDFYFTAPGKEDFGLIDATAVAPSLKRSMLADLKSYYFDYRVISSGLPVDLKAALREGHLNIPPASFDAVSVRKRLQPVKARVERTVDLVAPILPFIKRWGTSTQQMSA